MSGETEYVGGELYRATVFGDSEEIVAYRGSRFGYPWRRLICDEGVLHVADVTNVTGPLRFLGPDERVVEPGQVVLDLDALGWNTPGMKKRLVESLENEGYGNIAEAIAEQIAPPRTPEPGFGAVVEAGVKGREGRHLFVRAIANGVPMWQSQDGRTWVTWASLIDPVVKRDGVES